MSDELTQLEAERRLLVDMIERQQRANNWLLLIAIVVVGAVAFVLLSAVIAGQLSLHALLIFSVITGILAYILTREFRYQGKVVSIGEILMLLTGSMVVARDIEDDPKSLRQEIAECDRRIENFRAGRD